MHGNVFEWVQDTYQENYEDAPDDGQSWVVNGDFRVVRGGSLDLNPLYLRSASRAMNAPDERNLVVGFRVVCSPSPAR